MAEFSSGVAGYVYGTAQVTATFPVDFRGSAEICCHQCRYYRRNYRSCGLNGEICEYPEKHIGSRCPLTFHIEEENTHEKGELEQRKRG